MYNRYRSCIVESDFIAFSDVKHTNSPVPYTTPDSSSLPANTWAFNPTYGAAHMNKTLAEKRGGFTIPLGYLKKGDAIKASCEFLLVSGVKPRLEIFNKTETQVRTYYADDVDTFNTLSIQMVAFKDGQHEIYVGLTTPEIGEFYVRNIQSEIISKISEKKPYTKNIQTFAVKTIGTGVFELNAQFANDACTFDFNGDFLKITFDRPFTGYGSSTNRAITFISQRATGNTQDYDIRTAFEEWKATGSFIELLFYERGTTTRKDPTTIPSGVAFDVLVVGLDKGDTPM